MVTAFRSAKASPPRYLSSELSLIALQRDASRAVTIFLVVSRSTEANFRFLHGAFFVLVRRAALTAVSCRWYPAACLLRLYRAIVRSSGEMSNPKAYTLKIGECEMEHLEVHG